MQSESKSEKGTFVISLDTEAAWGRINLKENSSYFYQHRQVKTIVVDLLKMFDKYDISVTWAIVGRLVDPDYGGSKKELTNFYPNLYTEELYNDKTLHNQDESVILIPELLSLIQKSKIKHEIASHSYNHILFDQQDDNSQQYRDDLALQNDVFGTSNVRLKTMVFPQNRIGALSILKELGYQYFRGQDISWYSNWPKWFHKIGRQIDFLFQVSPTMVSPTVEAGLIRLDSSFVFRVPSKGWKRHARPGNMANKSIAGLNRAADTKGIFHVYFHPFNFGYKRQAHMQAWEKVLNHAAKLRDDGLLDILSMGDLLCRQESSLITNKELISK